MADGVDVSRHQNSINWKALRAADIDYAYIKVTEGVGYVDPRVDRHLPGARTAGLATGLYHFARPDTNAASADAEHFAAEVNERHAAGPGNLPPCLDLEELRPGALAGIDLIAWVSEFLAVARRKTGRRQFILYASASFLKDRLKGLGWLDNDCLVWVAHYGRDPGKPGWRDHRTVMHQYTSRGRVNGYSGDIDLNRCWVNLTTLTAGGGLPTQPAPPTPPPPPPASDDDHHIVQPGETLSGIAEAHNFPGGWKALYQRNRDIIGNDPDRIYPGQRLRIDGGQAPADRWHTVRPGENLSSIAKKYKVTGGWKAIWDANRALIDDPDIIFPDQRLRIPR